MGMFDDLIPKQDVSSSPQGEGGMFDDLIPKQEEPKQEEPGFYDKYVKPVGRVAAQFPLGIARGAMDMMASAAPAHLAEAAAMNPRMDNRSEAAVFNPQEAAKSDPMRPELYEKQKKEFEEKTGIEGEMSPRNLPEHMASGVGRAMPWAPLGAAPGMGMGANLAIQGVAGAAGAGTEYQFPELGHWGNLLGSLVGAVGAGKVANALGRILPEANEFGIPFTRGQRGADPAALALEEDIRKGGKGPMSQGVMTNFDKNQRAASNQAIEDVGTGLGGQPTSPLEAGTTVGTALEKEASARKQAADAFYDRAAEKDAWVHDTHDLSRQIRVGLHEEQFPTLDAVNHPGAMRAMRLVEHMSDETGVASVQKMEQTRKALNLMNKHPETEDGRALRIIKRAYDKWEGDVVTNRLLTGDKTALDDIERARGLWKQYKDLTGRKDGPDRVIAEIINGEHSPEKIANMITGASSIGGSSLSAGVIRRIREIFPQGTPEFDAVRQSVFNKLTVNPLREDMSPRQTAKAIREFIQNKGAPVARELFTLEERQKMLRLASALEQTSPKQVNASGSGTTVARLMLPAIGTLGGAAAGYLSGDPKYYALMALPWVRDANAVRRAMSAIKDVRYPVSQAGQMLPVGAREAFEGVRQ